jgi:mannose/fructose/N-acetylgalactosamine-specific phosphotransferase system component IID
MAMDGRWTAVRHALGDLPVNGPDPQAPAEQQTPQVSESSRFAAILYSFVLQAGYNYEGFQNLGLCAALRPALTELHPDPAERDALLMEHLEYFNANPFVSPFALGAIIHLEEQRAAGGADAPTSEQISRTKRALGSLLGNIGDRVFWAGLLPVAALAGMVAYLLSPLYGAITLLLTFNVPHLLTRAEGFRLGYRLGVGAAPALAGPGSTRTIRWIQRFGAFLVGLILPLAIIHPLSTSRLETAGLILAAGGVSYALLQSPLRRVLALLLIAGLISLYALLT